MNIWHLFHISIDSKLISVCLINDYLLIADLFIFVYGSAERATISFEYTKLKLLILNNFANQSFIYQGQKHTISNFIRGVFSKFPLIFFIYVAGDAIRFYVEFK